MLTQLSRRDWQRFFSRMSAALAGGAAHVEPAGLDEDLPGNSIGLAGVSYDAAREELVLALEGDRRLVRHPREVHVHWEEDLLHSLELVDADGRRDFVVLRKPLRILSRER